MKQWEKELNDFYWLDQNTKEQLEDLIETALDQQKQEMVEAIKDQENKMKTSKWLDGMGLSGSQAEFIEANVTASYDVIIKKVENQ